MLLAKTIERRAKFCGLGLLLFISSCLLMSRSRAADNTTTLSEVEAKILVYVSPVGEAQRDKGLDIAMEAQSSAQLNQTDYYYFWVYNSKREQSNSSVTIGYFAVNRHTADVWDTDEKKMISSKLMLGAQAIIRQSHRIEEATIDRYRASPF